MSHLVSNNWAWPGGAGVGVAAALAVLPGAAGDIIQQARPANTLRLRCTLAWGVAPTNARVKIEWRTHTAWVPLSVVNSVVAGVVSLGDGVFDLPVAAAGTHEICVAIPPGADLRVTAWKVEGAVSDVTLLARATLTDE